LESAHIFRFLISSLFNKFKLFIFKIEKLVGGDDECVIAADIYQCGKEKAPSVTNAIQSGLTNNVAPTVAVRFCG